MEKLLSFPPFLAPPEGHKTQQLDGVTHNKSTIIKHIPTHKHARKPCA